MILKYTLPVERLYCIECARSLGVVVESMNGIKTAKVSFQKGLIVGLHDDEVVTLSQVIKKVESLGYRVTDHTALE